MPIGSTSQAASQLIIDGAIAAVPMPADRRRGYGRRDGHRDPDRDPAAERRGPI